MKTSKPYEYSTFADYLEGIGEMYGDKPALSVYDRRGQETMLTYRQLSDKAKALATVFADRNLSGAHIGIVGENSLEWVIAYLGITASGNIAVCVDAEQSDANVEEMLVMADVQILFSGADSKNVGEKMLSAGKVEEHYELEGKGKDSVSGLCEKGEALIQEKGQWAHPVLDPYQTAALVFTSGTTSVSKMVLLSHHNILINVSDSLEGVEAGPKVFSALPCYHTYGMTTAVLATLVRGAHLCLNGNMRTVMRDMMLSKPYCMTAVPLMVEAIYKQILLGAQKAGKQGMLDKMLRNAARKRRRNGDVSCPELEAIWQQYFGGLKLIICGGAHLSVEIEEAFELFGVHIMQGYGITECSPMVSANECHGGRLGSVGRTLACCQVRVVDEEIQVRGENVMKGYYKGEDQMKEVMDGEWFRTGDLGYVDKDGYIYITGRKKNLIVFKNGKKLSPEKLETLIMQIPIVKEVMVHGASQGTSADDVSLAASIYPDPELTKDMSTYDILDSLQNQINQINQTLPLYQHIQMVNIREQEFKKTASKKIKRYLA